MATDKVSLLSSHTQFPLANHLDTREIRRESFELARGSFLHMAIIQQSVRRWEKPWRHQRAIVLFANSLEETKRLSGRTRFQCLSDLRASFYLAEPSVAGAVAGQSPSSAAPTSRFFLANAA